MLPWYAGALGRRTRLSQANNWRRPRRAYGDEGGGCGEGGHGNKGGEGGRNRGVFVAVAVVGDVVVFGGSDGDVVVGCSFGVFDRIVVLVDVILVVIVCGDVFGDVDWV